MNYCCVMAVQMHRIHFMQSICDKTQFGCQNWNFPFSVKTGQPQKFDFQAAILRDYIKEKQYPT